MTVTINFPPELESTLRERAAASGKELAALVREAVEEKLAREPAAQGIPSVSTPDNPTASYSEWKTRFDAWMEAVDARARRYPEGYVANDGREEIYGDRDE